MKWFAITLALFFIFSFNNGAKSQSLYWQTSFGTNGNETCNSLKEYSDGSIYAFGTTDSGTIYNTDAVLYKLDKYGNILWKKCYGDSANNSGLFINHCTDGNFILIGETTMPNGLNDVWIKKIDTAGVILWSNVYGTPANESCKYIEQTHDGGYIMCGYQSHPSLSNEAIAIKLDSVGNTLWDVTVGGPLNEYADQVHELPDYSFVMTSDGNSVGAGGYDVQISRFDSSGILKFVNTYGNAFNQGCQGLLLTSKTELISYGETEIAVFSPFDFFIEKIDTAGNSKWKKVFGGSMTDALFDLIELPNSNFVLTGYTRSYNTNPSYDIILAETDTNGILQWYVCYGGNGIDIGYEVIHSVFGGYILCGKYWDNLEDFFVLHADVNGMIGTNSPEKKSVIELSVYPNPAEDKIVINQNAGNQIHWIISDLNGNIIEQNQFSTHTETIDIRNLKPGVYILSASSGQMKQKSFRIQKK